MIKLRLLLFLSLFPLSNFAAVIYGNLHDVGDVAILSSMTKVTFLPTFTPASSTDGLTTYLDYVKSTNIWPGGWFTNTLTGGSYDTRFTASKTISIIVPTNGGPYTFDYCAQLATNAPVFSYPLVLGLISSYFQMGTNVFFITNNPGVLGEQLVISTRTNWNFQTEITNSGNLPAWASNTPTVFSASITNKSGWCVDRGVATLVGGKVTPSSTWSYTTNIILISRIASTSTTNTWVTVGAVTAGVRFEINSSSGGDTANVNWAIFLP